MHAPLKISGGFLKSQRGFNPETPLDLPLSAVLRSKGTFYIVFLLNMLPLVFEVAKNEV